MVKNRFRCASKIDFESVPESDFVRCQQKVVRAVLVTALFLKGMEFGSSTVIAGVDPGERYQEERERAMDTEVLGVEKEKSEPAAVVSPPTEVTPEEIKRLKKELLHFPKKKRFRFGGDFDMTHDTNPVGLGIHHEESDTSFNLNPFTEVDLSGVKTDLRLEFRESNHYNVKRSKDPSNDTLGQEGRIRFGRRIVKKTDLSFNERLSRTSTRVSGIDDGTKVTWSNSARAGLSYTYNPKLVLNLEVNHSATLTPHEIFDQDRNYVFNFDPNLLFRPTPKTQLSMGYRWSIAHSRTEVSDTTSHIFRMGYSGKITPKSSVSLDFSWTIQDPVSIQAANSKQYSTSVGYIWQVTRKTSVRLSYSNSYQHTLSDAVSDAQLLKTSVRSFSNTLGLSTRLRLRRKISTEFSFNGAHGLTRTQKTGSDNAKAQTWTLPFQLAIDYDLARWIRLRFSYTFRYRLGDEPKTDEIREHTWLVSTNVAL